MADREFDIKVKIEGDAASFSTNLAEASKTLGTFKKEVNDLNRALLGAVPAMRDVRENARSLAVDLGYAERAVTSLTRWTRIARDQTKEYSDSLKQATRDLAMVSESSRILADAQRQLAADTAAAARGLGSTSDQAQKLSNRMVLTGTATRLYAAAAREAAVASEEEAAALDTLGDKADKAAAKLSLLAAVQGGMRGINWSGLFMGGGRRLPWYLGGALGGAALRGGIASETGLNPVERTLTLAASVGGSALQAGAGGLLLGGASLATTLVGAGSDAAVMHSTIADTKTLYQNYTALTAAIQQYGAHSRQAAQAQSNLNQQMRALGPGATKELALAKQVAQLNAEWDKVTGAARGQATALLGQGVGVGNVFAPLVANAANRNLGIINQDIKPLVDFIKGPGQQIFTQLEDTFAARLPHAVHAFDQALELALKTVSYIDQKFLTGSFIARVDAFFSKWNDRRGIAGWYNEIDKLVGVFHVWQRFVHALFFDIYHLFHDGAGEGTAFIGILTKWLTEFGKWETSVKGAAWLKTFFKDRTQELEAILRSVPAIATAFGHLYMSLQRLVPVWTLLANLIADALGALQKASPLLATVGAGYLTFGGKLGLPGPANLARRAVSHIPGLGGLVKATKGETPANPMYVWVVNKAGGGGGVPGEGGGGGLGATLGVDGAALGAAALYGAPLILAGLLSSPRDSGKAQNAAQGLSGYIPSGELSQITQALGGISGAQGSRTGNMPWSSETVNIIKQADVALKSFASTGNVQGLDQVLQKVKSLEQEWPQAKSALDPLVHALNQAAQTTFPQLANVTNSARMAVVTDFNDMKTQAGAALSDIMTHARLNSEGISSVLGTGSHTARVALAENFRLAAGDVAQSMRAGVVATAQGMKAIAQLLSKALAALGAPKGLANSLAAAAASGNANAAINVNAILAQGGVGGTGSGNVQGGGLATGGILGNPNATGRDMYHVVMGEGEAVLTRHQRAYIDRALPGGMSVAGVVNSIKQPHYAASGFVGGSDPFMNQSNDPKIGIGGLLGTIAQDSVDAVFKAAGQAFNNSGGSIGGGMPGHPFALPGGIPQTGGNRTLGREMMLAMGWGANEWPALDALWTGESGWNANAVNPSSGAYGIPQALGHGNVFALGDARAQIAWGLNYIKSTYGDPNSAYATWLSRSPHSYNQGGIIGAAAGLALRGHHSSVAPQLPRQRVNTSKGSPRKPAKLQMVKQIPGIPGLLAGFSYPYDFQAAEYAYPAGTLTGMENYAGGNAAWISYLSGPAYDLLTSTLALTDDTDPNTGAPLSGPQYVYGQDHFYPGDPANPSGFIGAWKYDQEIAARLAIYGAENNELQNSPGYLSSLGKWVGNAQQAGKNIGAVAIKEAKALQNNQRYLHWLTIKKDRTNFAAQRMKIHDEFIKLRANIRARGYRGQYSASAWMAGAQSILAGARGADLNALASLNILDPTTVAIERNNIETAYSQGIASLRQRLAQMTLNNKLNQNQLMMVSSLAETDALFGISQREGKYGMKRAVLDNAIFNETQDLKTRKHDLGLIATNLLAADASSLTSVLQGDLNSLLINTGLGPVAVGAGGSADIKSEIQDRINQLGIDVPQENVNILGLEKNRNAITGSSTSGATNLQQIIDLQSQLLTYAVQNAAAQTAQLGALQGFTPLLGAMGSFAKGGVVPETGMYLLHQDETVVPDQAGPSRSVSRGGDTHHHHLELHLSGGMEALEPFIEAVIRKRGQRPISAETGRRTRVLSTAPGII